MARTKISEYSATAADNTDINSINIAEGCAPSGINNAIREMMKQLKDFQAGTSGDSFTNSNVVLTGGSINGTTIGASTASTGAFTNLSYTGTLTGSTGVLNIGSGQIYKDASGNVGIGTNAPAAKFAVSTGDTKKQFVVDLSSDPVVKIGLPDWYNVGALAFVNGTAAGEVMRITSSGNLLVGTTTQGPNIFSTGNPRLTVNAVISATDGNVSVNLGGNSGNEGIFFNSSFLRVYNASGAGVFLANGGTSWSGTSDERLKTDLNPITNAVEKVNSLRAVIGRFKTDEPEKKRSFLIAQDVQKVLPEAISEMDGYLGIQYTDTIPLLVAAIQELKAEVDSLKSQLNGA